MFSFYELFELAQIRAITAALEPTMASVYRSRCRTYSERFHTPLHVVMNELEPMFVLEALYEDQYKPSIVEDELEELVEILQKIKDPSYSRMTKEEMEDLVDAVLNKELARVAKKKRPTEETIETEIKEAQHKPKSGSMNFSDLEKIDANAENNKAGFDQ